MECFIHFFFYWPAGGDFSGYKNKSDCEEASDKITFPLPFNSSESIFPMSLGIYLI